MMDNQYLSDIISQLEKLVLDQKQDIEGLQKVVESQRIHIEVVQDHVQRLETHIKDSIKRMNRNGI